MFLKGKLDLSNKKILLFTRTIKRAENLVSQLNQDGFSASFIHSKISIPKRRSILNSFSLQEGAEVKDEKKHINMLVSTDLMSRGIDIENIEVVINYDIPERVEDYIHRVGRTGRADKEGISISFVSKDSQIISLYDQVTERNEEFYFKKIETQLPNTIEKRKIPGPWKEVDLEDAMDNESKMKIELRAKELAEKSEKKVKHMMRMKLQKKGKSTDFLNEKQKDPSLYEKMLTKLNKERFEKAKEKIKEKESYNDSSTKLGKFYEGRYENLLTTLKEKKLKKLDSKYKEIILDGWKNK